MVGQRVRCPGCQVLLDLPPAEGALVVRCPKCRESFRVPPPAARPSVDDTIAGWLTDGDSEDDEPAAAKAPSRPAGGDASGPAVSVAPKPPRQASKSPIRVVKVARNAVLFEFPARRLREPAFRCGMPRRCMRCETTARVFAHVIIYSSTLGEGLTPEAARAAGALALRDESAKDLPDDQLLERLPRVPNVVPPADQPMPYWLCDRCHEGGAIAGQIRVNPDTGEGNCRLLMSNLRVAHDFLMAVGGEDAPGCAELAKAVRKTQESPWDSLTVAVRNRLEQWYSPKSSEQFIVYVPDRDRAPSEDGCAGIVITNQRLIHRLDLRRHEIPSSEPVVITVAQDGYRYAIRLSTPAWQVRRLCLDKEGLRRLRRGLSLGKFRVLWK